jgi:hypothetical protein
MSKRWNMPGYSRPRRRQSIAVEADGITTAPATTPIRESNAQFDNRERRDLDSRKRCG